MRRVPDRLTIPLAAIGGALLPWIALDLGRASQLAPLPLFGIGTMLAGLGLWRPMIAGRLAVAGVVLVATIVAIWGVAG